MAFNARLALAMGLDGGEVDTLRALATPEAIQDFITALPSNAEPHGDTCHSVRMVLRERCCHCIEAAFLAAAALMLHGQPALLMDLEAEGDDDHVVALFKRGGFWGAISKSNHIWLRWRDPVYRSLRELAMSYFHEYVIGHHKTLRTYSRPFNIGAYDPAYWLTREGDCWEMEAEIAAGRHFPLISAAQAKRLRKRERFEVFAGSLKEFGADMRQMPHAMHRSGG